MDGFRLKTVDVAGNHDPLIFDAKAEEPALAQILADVRYGELPLPVGVFRQVDRPVYEDEILQQEYDQIDRLGEGNLESLFKSGDYWKI